MAMLDQEGRKMMRSAGQTGAVGFEIAACLLMGYFAGHWLDAYFTTTPWLTIFGGLSGLAAAIKVLHRIIKTTDLDKL